MGNTVLQGGQRRGEYNSTGWTGAWGIQSYRVDRGVGNTVLQGGQGRGEYRPTGEYFAEIERKKAGDRGGQGRGEYSPTGWTGAWGIQSYRGILRGDREKESGRERGEETEWKTK